MSEDDIQPELRERLARIQEKIERLDIGLLAKGEMIDHLTELARRASLLGPTSGWTNRVEVYRPMEEDEPSA